MTPKARLAKPTLRFALLAALALTALLGACTGTRSTRAPTLLLVGYSEGGAGRLGVVEDTFLTDEAVANRFLFLSSTPLPATPVAYDVSDRDGARDELFVLSRAGTSAEAYLSIFGIANLTPSAEGSQPSASLELSYADLRLPEGLDAIDICPTRLQVSGDGRYVAVMHDLSLCQSGNLNDALDIVDLSASPPAIVQRFENTSVVPDALYLYQGGSDQVFYFREEAGGMRLRTLRLSTMTEESTDAIVVNARKGDGTTVRDLSRVGGELIALQANRFTPIADFADAPEALEPVTTSSSSRKLVPTNSSSPTAVMVLGSDSFTIHSDSSDASPDSATLTGVVDGSLEPVGGFVYFVTSGSNNLPIFDLREYDPASSNLDSNLGTRFGLPQITAPAFVTWAQSVLPPAP